MTWCANTGALHLSANSVLHARTKHIEIDLYFIREKIVDKVVEVRHDPSYHQIVDCFTKAISSSRFPILRAKLKVEALSTLSLSGAVRSKGS